MEKEQDIYAGYSPDVAEILRRKPHWIIRYGVVILAMVFALGLAATWFVPYPETINASIDPMYDGMISRNSVALTAIAKLPAEYGPLISPGMPVRVIIIRRQGANPVKVEGIVRETAIISGGRHCQVTVSMILEWDKAQELMSAATVKAAIIIDQTTLLDKIFNPVFAIFRGAKQNAQAINRP